jgi:small subunit ribosomal protein S5
MALINPDTLDLDEHVIQTNKVQKTHKGGRTMSWSILVAVGNHNGYVGAGIGKARAIPDAIRKGVEAAKKAIVHVPMVGTTIPHDVLVRRGAAEVMLKPASPGTGLVAGGSVRALLELAGVKDVLGKSLGSSNKVNTAWATLEALKKLKRASDVARLRGKDISELVSKSVAAATLEAESEDAAHGIAAVVPIDVVAPPATPVVETAVSDPVIEASVAAAPPRRSSGKKADAPADAFVPEAPVVSVLSETVAPSPAATASVSSEAVPDVAVQTPVETVAAAPDVLSGAVEEVSDAGA